MTHNFDPSRAGSVPLARRLTTVDATVIGLGSMIGAGVFAVFAPAAATAGVGMLIGLLIAAAVALLNALSSAQLAAQYPVSGGSYVYGRQRLGEWAGFFAGWSFVIGKTASCAAMALTVGYYLVPAAWVKPLAVLAILALALLNSYGITRTVGFTKILVAGVFIILGIIIAAGIWGDGEPTLASLDPAMLFQEGWYGILQSAGLLFFAFAGYARVATLGEEVKNPERAIPRAIISALGVVLIIYLVLGLVALVQLGPDTLAQSTEPLVTLVQYAEWFWAVPLVRLGATLAALGALLALMTGVSRTMLAMARNRDLPYWLATVHPKYQVPRHAEWVLATVVSVLVLSVDLRGVIGFSSFGVLLYYFITNLAALSQDSEYRRIPRILAVLGALACLGLVVTLPWESIVIGLVVILIGVGYRLIRMRIRAAAPPLA